MDRMLLEGDEVLIKEYSTFAGFVPDYGIDTAPRRFNCGKTSTHITVHWNGDVVICCRDFEGFTIVGNVNETPIEEIWKSPAYEHYRKQHETKNFKGNKLCKNC